MAGFKNGALALKKKDVGANADQNFINIFVDTSNNLYTIDEFGVYRSITGYDIVSSGSDINLITSGGTKIISLNSTGVVSGTYGTSTTVPQILIDNKGRILSAYNIPISASGLGTVTSVSISSSTLNVINSPITTFGTFGVNLSATGVVSGSILKPFVDIYGRVLSGGHISATDISDRSTDILLSANSDNKIPTEKAIKTYVDTKRLYVSTGISVDPSPNFINNNNGTLTIEPTTCRLYSTTNFVGNIDEYNVAGTTLALTDGIEQHICIKYNSGNPIYYVEDNDININDSDVICVYIVWRQGLEIHSLSMDSLGLGLGNKTLHAINNTTPYRKSYLGGLIISETSSPNPRTIAVTSGDIYAGIVEQKVYSFNSSTDRLTLAYHNSGIWTYTDNLVYNNTQYDNGTNLVTIGNNKYSVRWYYRSVGDVKQTFYVLGTNQHNNISDARLELPRTDIPMLLIRHCILVGRSIIQYNSSTGITESISDITFSQSVVQSHNDLNNIQGGDSTGNYYHVSATTFGYLSAVSADIQLQLNSKMPISIISALQEPTGFIDKNQTMTFNNVTRTFNISASGGFNVFYRGNVFQKTSDSITISNTSGNHFIYYTSAGTLVESSTPWDISTTIQVALVYWTGTSSFGLCEERHGTVMDWATHQYNHKNNGTRYTSGLNATYVLNSDTSAGIGLSNGTISDEDIEINITNGSINNYFSQPINFPASIPVYYRSGTDGIGTWRKDIATTLPYKNNGGTGINFNQLLGGNWTQTPANSNYYVAYYIYATDIINEPIISVQGQRQDSTLINAQNNNSFSSLIFQDFPVQEAKLLYRLILQTLPSYTGNIYRSVIVDVTDYRNYSANLINTGGTGTVTYVGLSANPIFSISGSPIINAGTFTLNLSNQLSGTFLAGPVSGASSEPIFRSLQYNDLPINSLSNNYLPLSGGTLTGSVYGTTIGLSAIQPLIFYGSDTYNSVYSRAYIQCYPGTGYPFTGIRIVRPNDGGFIGSNPLPFSVSQASGGSPVFEITSAVTYNRQSLLVSGTVSGTNAYFGDYVNSNFCTVNGGSSQAKGFVIKDNGNTRFILDVDSVKVTEFRSYTSAQIQIDTPISWGNNSSSDIIQFSRSSNFSGNVTANTFVGNLNGYKLVDNVNESTLASGYNYSGGRLYLNYRGASLPITEYRLCDGLGSGTLAGVLASAFIKSGGTSSEFLKADGSVDSNSYVTSATISQPLNQIVYGTGSGITSSPNYIFNTSTSKGITVTNNSSTNNTYLSFITGSNSSSYWAIQKRDVSDYGTTLGCFSIEDSTAGLVNQRFPLIIDSGATGIIRFSRPVLSNSSVSALQQIQTTTTFRSLLAGNYASVILNSNGAWVGIGTDGTTNNTLKIGATAGDQNWTGIGNIVLGGTVSAGNLFNSGNYYASNYSAGSNVSLITNNGNARFFTLSLIDYNSTTGGGSLIFTDANIGATGGTFFSNSGKQNSVQLKGNGNPGYGGLYFGENNSEYIGVKGSGYLYLGASTKLQVDTNQIYMNSTGTAIYGSTYDVTIASTNGNIDLSVGSNLTTDAYNTYINSRSQISVTAHSGMTLNCDSNIYINSVSGIIYSQQTMNCRNNINDMITVTALTAATTASNIYQIPDGYNIYYLTQGTTTAYRNYRLPIPNGPKFAVFICGDSASGNLLCNIVRPGASNLLYNSSGSSITSFQRGGAIPLFFDGTDWYCAVTI